MPPETVTVRYIEPRVRPIVRATDLGSVQVLKHGNLYLLTDPFGDIHPDSRGLGLYHGDTRILSCSVLRVHGERPVLLQGSAGANYRGSIQLTNPSADRNPDAKVHPADELVGRTIGISRERLICTEAFQERIRIVNHASRPESISIELELGADGADIFEVRGYPRPARGTLRAVATTPERVTFRYDGLDGRRRSTFVAFSEAAAAVDAVAADTGDSLDTGAAVRFRWSLALDPHQAGEIRWTAWTTTTMIPADPEAEHPAALFPVVPMVSADEGAAAYHAWQRGTTAISSDHELFNLIVARSIADLRLLVNEGPGRDERYIAAGVPWFATLFGRDAIITALQSVAFRPQLAVEILSVLAAHQATRGRRLARRRARQDPPRAADRGDGGERRAAAHAVLRLHRQHPAVADPARRDVRLDR